jgi:hypothetical protein
MTLATIVMRNGTLIKFDADSASIGPNVLNPPGFNFMFKGAKVPQILHLRTEQVDAVFLGDVLIGDQLLSPQPANPPTTAPAPAPAATPAKP